MKKMRRADKRCGDLRWAGKWVKQMTWAEVGREDGLRRVEGSWEEVEELRPKSRWETLKTGEKRWKELRLTWEVMKKLRKNCWEELWKDLKKNWDDLRRVATGLEVVATTEKSAPRRKRISRTELRRCESSLHFIRFGSYHIPLFPAGKFSNPPRAGFNCIAAVCDTCCHAKSKLTGSYSLRPAITDTKRSGQHVPMFKSPFGSSNLQWGCMEPDLFCFYRAPYDTMKAHPQGLRFLLLTTVEKRKIDGERAARRRCFNNLSLLAGNIQIDGFVSCFFLYPGVMLCLHGFCQFLAAPRVQPTVVENYPHLIDHGSRNRFRIIRVSTSDKQMITESLQSFIPNIISQREHFACFKVQLQVSTSEHGTSWSSWDW